MGIFSRRLTQVGLNAVEAELAARLRAEDFEGARALVTANTAKYGGAYEPLCRKLEQRFVAIDGWDDALADFEELSRKGRAPAAFEITIVGASRGAATLDCSWRDNSAYEFSGASRESLLGELGAGAPKWAGRTSVGTLLAVSNLAPLHKTIMADPSRGAESEASAEYVARRLAVWTLYARVHMAVKQQVEKCGLPRAMPVFVGDRDIGPPSFSSVYMAPARGGHERAVEKILAARRKSALTPHDHDTEKMIEELAMRRQSVRSWPKDQNPEKRAAFVEQVRAYDALILGALGLSLRSSTADMADAEFAELTRAVRRARARAA